MSDDQKANAAPRPGSERAINAGCRCPVIDNHYGNGVPSSSGPQFWISGDCPIHFLTPAEDDKAGQSEVGG